MKKIPPFLLLALISFAPLGPLAAEEKEIFINVSDADIGRIIDRLGKLVGREYYTPFGEKQPSRAVELSMSDSVSSERVPEIIDALLEVSGLHAEKLSNQRWVVYVNDELPKSSSKKIEISKDHSILVARKQTGIVASHPFEFDSKSLPVFSGKETKIDKKVVDGWVNNLPHVLTQARAVPYFKAGNPIGMRFFAVKKGSPFHQIGLKNGDILQEVNGERVADPTRALKLFSVLKEQKELKLKVLRSNKIVELSYHVK